MKASIEINNKHFKLDLNAPIDISIPLRAGPNNVHAWYVEDVKIEPVMNEFFVGDVNKGGAVNFKNIFFNPHGHGTHTECVGHISKENYTINQELKQFFFPANLISIQLTENENGDKIIDAADIENKLRATPPAAALIIRTFPNEEDKLAKNYSNSNPAFLSKEAMQTILNYKIDHLLVDTPSIDKEVDGGELAAHHLFWEYPTNTQKHRSITELIFVPNEVVDGFYLLNIQIAAFESDASPSKPILFVLSE